MNKRERYIVLRALREARRQAFDEAISMVRGMNISLNRTARNAVVEALAAQRDAPPDHP